MIDERHSSRLHWLSLGAALLAWCVVVLGAYVRLSDAGLGCPDWPGCYGHISVPVDPGQQQAAAQLYPGKSVEVHKAWKEMVHRYVAGTLGLLILAIFISSWAERRHRRPTLPGLLLGLVVFQALLGMWTVTQLLKPIVVTAHLLGGMSVLALLAWLGFSRFGRLAGTAGPQAASLRIWAALGLAILIVQIALGGWTSSNYAGMACGETLICRGEWLPDMDFSSAFVLTRKLGMTADGGYLPMEGLVAIHWLHRLGAVVTFAYLAWLSARLMATGFRRFGLAVSVLLVTQVALGIANIRLGLPLALAVMHNGVAALLLVSLVVLNFSLHANEVEKTS